jgi:cobalt-zinc-cadmium efflux system protein
VTSMQLVQKPKSSLSLFMSVGLRTFALLLELVGGIVTGSFALESDAAHLFTDLFSGWSTYFANKRMHKPADTKMTYGYERYGTLSALANSFLAIIAALILVAGALYRLVAPSVINASLMLYIALLALAINLTSLMLVHEQRGELHIKSYFLHVMYDLLSSITIVIAALIIKYFHFYYFDAIATLCIAGIIVWTTAGVLGEAISIFLEQVPKGISLSAVREELSSVPHVVDVHDLHVWTLSGKELALSCHVVVDENSINRSTELLAQMERKLCDRFGIGHTTLQLELERSCAESGNCDIRVHNHPHSD